MPPLRGPVLEGTLMPRYRYRGIGHPSTFKWDPSLGVQEGATCEYLLVPFKYLNGLLLWAVLASGPLTVGVPLDLMPLYLGIK